VLELDIWFVMRMLVVYQAVSLSVSDRYMVCGLPKLVHLRVSVGEGEGGVGGLDCDAQRDLDAAQQRARVYLLLAPCLCLRCAWLRVAEGIGHTGHLTAHT